MSAYNASRAGAIALASLFAAGTAFVLFEDVIRHGATLTNAHVLTALALVGTIAAGHYVAAELRQRSLLTAFGLAVLFLAGTAYIVTASGVRNAEVATVKAATIAAANARRAAIAHDLMLARREHEAASDAARRECVKVGTQCERKTQRVGAAWSRVLELEASLAGSAPERAPDAGYQHFGQLLASLGVPQRPETIAAALALVAPYILVLIAELGTLVFGHIALRGARRHAFGEPAAARSVSPRTQEDTSQTSFPVAELPPAALFSGEQPVDEPPLPPRGTRKPRRLADERREQVTSFVTAFRARHGVDPSPAAVRQATGLPRSTAWRWQQQVA